MQIDCQDFLSTSFMQIDCQDFLSTSFMQIDCQDFLSTSFMQVDCQDFLSTSLMQVGCQDFLSTSLMQVVVDSVSNYRLLEPTRLPKSDPVYTVPDSLGHDIEFVQFAVIFTLTTFSISIFYFLPYSYRFLLLNSVIYYHIFKSHTRLETIQFDIVTMWIPYRVNEVSCGRGSG